ncbi:MULTISPECIES: ABC transporter ATP-binding protein [Salinibaculum]|uniref:ABC transporter ATP-binding protein n=1 Tax=Salinibaculum TaxID=2732368 RepID=UPI0030D3C44F
MPEPAVALRSLTKHYGEVVGIEDLTLTVDHGEAFGFLGPNGAGKSTAIRTLLGFQSPTSGEARVLGTDVTDRRAFTETKRRIGHLPSDFDFYGGATGSSLLDYYGQLKGDDRREEMLARFPVPVDRAVRTYSRGNRQKLAIVQAFMHDPDLLVMDEPTTGLDPMVQHEFRRLLETERDRGKTVVFSSHILGDVGDVCDRVAIVRNGRLVELDSVSALLARAGKLVRAEFDGPPDPAAFDIDGVSDVRVTDEGVLELVVADNYGTVLDRLNRGDLRDVEIREADIEEVFMHYYEGEVPA